jgi:CBS domain-containing protein
MSVATLSDRISKGDPALSHRQGTIVVDEEGRLAGLITRGDIMRVLQKGSASATSVLEAAGTDVAVTYPDETLQEAISTMLRRGVGRLPVVERGDPRKVVGYLGRADILAARGRVHDEEELRERGPLLEAERTRQGR